MIYIQIDQRFVDTNDLIPQEQLGTTIDDYYSGKYIPLSQEQVAFMEQYPHSTPEEVFRMVYAPSEEELFRLALKAKMSAVYNYDHSHVVNTFFINDTPSWLNRVARASLAFTLSAYKANSINSLTLWTTGANPVPFEISVTRMEEILFELELYAKKCFDTTMNHKTNILSLESSEDITAYDHTQGYPEILRFTI